MTIPRNVLKNTSGFTIISQKDRRTRRDKECVAGGADVRGKHLFNALFPPDYINRFS